MRKDDDANLLQRSVRRFLLFGGPCYYASGGFFDYVRSFDTSAEAFAFATMPRRPSEEFDWWHIFDMDERRIVAWSETTPYGADGEYPKLDKE